MTVKCRAGKSPGARSRCQSHTSNALSRRQPDRARCGTAPLISEPDTLCARLGLPPLVRPARKAQTRGVPPLLPAPLPAGPPRTPGGCLHPILLRGRVDPIVGVTGELLHRYTTVHEPGGVLPIACKTRRASQCPPCAEVYRADTYQLIRAGLSGGKGIPDTVATHPCVFTTLTAPSFGPVHVHREKDGRLLRCRPVGIAASALTGAACPEPRDTAGTTLCSVSRCAPTATTTPARSCSTPAPPNCGAASPSPSAEPSPARPG